MEGKKNWLEKFVIIYPCKRKLKSCALKYRNGLYLNPKLQSLANVSKRVCFAGPDGTDFKKTNKWGLLLDRVRSSSLKMLVTIVKIVRFNSLSPTRERFSAFNFVICLLKRFRFSRLKK